MIYLFTFGNIHKFYQDGKIYMHSCKDNVFFVDEDYKDNTRRATYIETTEYYILKVIFKIL